MIFSGRLEIPNAVHKVLQCGLCSKILTFCGLQAINKFWLPCRIANPYSANFQIDSRHYFVKMQQCSLVYSSYMFFLPSSSYMKTTLLLLNCSALYGAYYIALDINGKFFFDRRETYCHLLQIRSLKWLLNRL